MAFRFRKSVKIVPGVRLNLSASGASVTVGGRGARTTFSARGTRTTIGIPGTGLSYSTYTNHRAEARQAEREARERARAEAITNVRVVIEDDGRLVCLDAHGALLRGRELAMAWERHGRPIRAKLEARAAEINGEAELLADIHLDTPPPGSRFLTHPPFDEPAPPRPSRAALPPPPQWREPPRPGLLARLVGGGRRHARRAAEARTAHERALEEANHRAARLEDEHRAALETWLRDCAEHEERRLAHEAEGERAVRAIATDPDAATAALEVVFQSLDWPRETLVSFEVADDGRAVFVDVDLPEIEDLPQRVASLAASGKRLTIKAKSQTTLRLEYARHVHGIVLRIAGVAAAALPHVERIVVSGFSQRLDRATGLVGDDYLLSVIFTRNGLARVDHDRLADVDPMEAIAAFEHRRRMTTTGVFKPVEPFKHLGGA
jgi:hypothetical protein